MNAHAIVNQLLEDDEVQRYLDDVEPHYYAIRINDVPYDCAFSVFVRSFIAPEKPLRFGQSVDGPPRIAIIQQAVASGKLEQVDVPLIEYVSYVTALEYERYSGNSQRNCDSTA